MPPRFFFYRNSYGYMISDRRAVKAIKLLYQRIYDSFESKTKKGARHD